MAASYSKADVWAHPPGIGSACKWIGHVRNDYVWYHRSHIAVHVHVDYVTVYVHAVDMIYNVQCMYILCTNVHVH